MFSLGVQVGRLATRPYLARPKGDNVRTQSFSRSDLVALLDVLEHGRPATEMEPEVKAQPDLVPPIMFAAITGWRLKSDVLTLEWRSVDFAAGTVTRWSRGTSKAHEHIVFPIDAGPELKALLERQREATSALERATGTIIPLVFHRHGRPIRSMHMAWKAACRRAGAPNLVPHDLRRTAARTLRALGMSDRDIAELVGWRTVAMVARYLGRDPAGVAERLRRRVAESIERSGTRRARGGNSGAGE
jgi:integrase